MRQFLSTLSIKLQVFLPVLFTVVLLVIGLSVGIGKLDQAFNKVSTSTNKLIIHKEELSAIVDNTYAMRIKAIYSYLEPKMSNLSTKNCLIDKTKTAIFSIPSIASQAFKPK